MNDETLHKDTIMAESDNPSRPVTVLHCSDLHFGAGFQWERLHTLAEQIERMKPDAVIVSGDLTMRARGGEFAAARRFLDGITAPLIVIPGNHDVPLYNLPLRLLDPFHNYRKHIGELGAKPLSLPGVVMYGLNTVNPFRHQEGIVRSRDLEAVEQWLGDQPRDVWRIVIAHQQFANIPGHGRPGVIPNAAEILRRLSEAGAHAVLCGHTHASYVVSSAQFFPGISRPMALVYAGTATSNRTRGAVPENTFNIFQFHADRFIVEACDYAHADLRFSACRDYTFDRAFFGEAMG